MSGPRWIGIAMVLLAMAGCKNSSSDSASIAPGEGDKWNDPNFEILTIGTFNYTDHPIAGFYLMQVDQSDINAAAVGSVRRPVSGTATDWEAGSSGPALAWDRRWQSPRKFKIWWQKIFDEEAFRRAGKYPRDGNMFDPYDPYTVRQTRPGSAWCESEFEVKEKFGEPYGTPFMNLTRSEFVVYFYPDGTVQGSLEFGGYRDIKLVDIRRRSELPVLKGRACVKEVPNPLYGKTKPKIIN